MLNTNIVVHFNKAIATSETSTSTSGTLPVMSTSGTLGALIGLLAAALVVVVAGWIVSCVYFQRKINK